MFVQIGFVLHGMMMGGLGLTLTNKIFIALGTGIVLNGMELIVKHGTAQGGVP